MAGAATRAIRDRIKSVESTMQLTKAMELVATSKLRRVKERADTVRPYFNALNSTFADLARATGQRDITSPYVKTRDVKKICLVVLAGDRGLAGGYNANIFRLATQVQGDKAAAVLPLGKRALEYYRRRPVDVLNDRMGIIAGANMEDCVELSDFLCKEYLAGTFDEVYIVYTRFASMMSQEATATRLLPIAPAEIVSEAARQDAPAQPHALAIFDPSSEEVFDAVVPRYLTGVMYGALCDSLASELAARRNAMESATDNAQEMIDDLSLRYNRARQGAITQEITEIVSGAQALG